MSEIDLIRKGELDSQLLQMNAKEIEVCSASIADKPKETIPLDSKLDNQRQKSWQKSVQILWQEIANHKSGPLFLNPIKKAKAPFYNKIVKKPLDLKIIKNRVREGVIYKGLVGKIIDDVL